MLIIKKGDICPHRTICPYNKHAMGTDVCWGARMERDCDFKCEYVVNGKITEGFSRNPMDKTGQMKILID